MVITHGAEMPGESENVGGAAATGDAEGAQPPSVGGAVAEVRVTVIPAHSPVGETAKPGKDGPRFFVCDYGPDNMSGWNDRRVKVRSFESGMQAHVYARELREAGHYVKVIAPPGSSRKRKQNTLNERLRGRHD